MENLIVSILLLTIFSLSIYKIFSEKRKGVKCVGCAISSVCSSKKQSPKRKFPTQIEIKEVL